MERTRLYIARHGQVVNHHELRYNGHTDVDITAEGAAQMERLAGFFSGLSLDGLYCSDLARSRRGADILGRAVGLEPVAFRELRELHLGRWEGLTRSEAMVRYPEDADFSFRDLATGRIEGGESLVDLKKRVVPVMERIIESHRGGDVCLVLHGGVNRLILCEAMGLGLENFFRIEQDYGCLNVIDVFDDGVQVVKLLNGGPNQRLAPTVLY
ncbi:MAG TPA: histidine phosphatase family protein [Deltaproteobacteria bacterium]|nr:histidine phosphatase family protein [Deltaproteobacteria bacterium]